MTLASPKVLFDAVRRIKGEALTQFDVDALNRAIAEAGSGGIKAASGELRPSEKAIQLVHSFEHCRLDAYPDPGSRDGNPWTIGWGSTGPGIARGVRWTREQCDRRFEEDLGRFSAGVVKLLEAAATSQGEFDALVSFAYNVGLEALRKSTLLRKHRAGDKAGAASEFGKWVNNDGRPMKGLVRRRAAEAELYRGQA